MTNNDNSVNINNNNGSNQSTDIQPISNAMPLFASSREGKIRFL